ncbi:MAG: AMP-binding protein [Clostridiales bacterium]|nr:AMP-binding protein [Clostridiales bacterium]
MENNHIIDLWNANKNKNPDEVLFVDALNPAGYTRKRIDLLSSKVCAYLKAKNIGREDAVVILMPRSALPFIVLLGVYKRGAAGVILEDHYPAERVAYITKDCNAKLVFDIQSWNDIQDLEPDGDTAKADMHDMAFAVYTSGTTGNPKGAVHEYGNVSRAVTTFFSNVDLTKKSFALIAPLNFVASMIVAHLSFAGVIKTVNILPYDIVKNPKLLFPFCRENKIEVIFASPSMLRAMNYLEGSGINLIYTGSEPANGIYKEGKNITNIYSMSESGIFVSSFDIDRAYDVCPIGSIHSNVNNIVLIDDNGEEAAAGEMGELCYPNPYFRGYLNLPEQTAEVLKDGLYHTGDLARTDEAGNIILLGRKNDMIKINGNRVEPGEIEAVAKEVLGIRWCAAKGFTTGTRAYLCLYYTEDISFDENEARLKMGEKLPYYMIPSFFTRIDQVPLLPNGKLNRKVLPEPELVHTAEYKAPETEIQKKICDAAQKILEIERIGINDDFYNLGGDSLSTMLLVDALDIPEITAADVFEGRTAEKIEKIYLEKLKMLEGFNPEEYEAEARKKEYELSPLQISYVDEYMYSPFDPSCDVPCLYEFDTDTDAGKLVDAVNKVMESSPVFSTVFRINPDGRIVQRYEPDMLVRTELTDMTEDELSKIRFYERFKLFGHTMAFCKVIRTEKRVLLYVTCSHSVMDGMGLLIVLDRITKAYFGEDLPLDTYYSCLARAESGRKSESYAGSKAYYEDNYAGRKWTYNLTPDKNDPDLSRVPAIFETRMTLDRLAEIEQKYGVTRNAVVLSAAIIALSGIEGSSDIMFNWTYHDRSDALKNNAAGIMMKRLPIGVDLSGTVTLGDLFDQVRMKSVEGIAHSNYSWLPPREDVLLSDTAGFVYESEDVMGLNAMSKMGGRLLHDQMIKTGSLRRFAVAGFEFGGKYRTALGFVKGYYSAELINKFGRAVTAVLDRIAEAEDPLVLPVRE